MEPLIKFEDDGEDDGEGEGARHRNSVFSAKYNYDGCLRPGYPPYSYYTHSNNDGLTIPATSPSLPPPTTTTDSATAGGVVGPSMSTPSSSSSSEDEEESCHNKHFLRESKSKSKAMMEATSKRLDYMLQFLDRKLESYSSSSSSLPDPQAPLPPTPTPPPPHNHNNHNHGAAAAAAGRGGGLPEFVAPVGWGIFAPPLRAPLHPGRPPPLEVRPHPLRESQLGRSLTALSATPSHLCSAREDVSLLLWDYSLLCAPSAAAAADGDDSDSDSPPHVVCQPGGLRSPVTCLVVAGESHTVWSGHKDGRIRCWKLSQPNNESLSWVAHPMKPLLSMTFSSYGDLWSGSEGGSLRIWPREAILRSLSSTADERHMIALLVERSYVDLSSQPSAHATCSVLNSDIRYLVSDHSRAKVWSADYLSFALWDARSRELLKVFNLDGQVERMDSLAGQDFSLEDDIKFKILAGSKKERVQNSLGFFQRSRNAIIGAADVVRRVAVKGGFGDDNRRTECLIATPDGLIWAGCANGLLVQWDGNGNRLQDFQYHSSAVQCLSSFGLHLWVGYASGMIQVLDLEGNLLGGWVAHGSPVIKMAVGAGYVFTLASHGGIRGWNVASPGPLDSILRSELAGKEFLYTRIESVRVLAGTWNVAQGRASSDSLISWLGSATGDASIVVVGLQEVEMGAGVLAMSAAKETVGLEGSSVGQWWLDMIGKTLDEGSTFVRIGSRQLAGLLIASWIRNDLRAYVGDVDAAAVPCGFGRAIGNKGAVGLRIRIYDRTVCFVNCHFAAHLEAVNRRNADFDHVYRTMTFGRPSNFFNTAAAGAASAVQMLCIPNVMGATPVEAIPELSQADMVIFLGDFNYRLDGVSYDEARDFISQRSFDWLKERDQLRAEMEAGNVFQGMREAAIRFPPTYKFDKYQPGLAGYDSGEKKRVPAWCDRILYRDSRSSQMSECCLECPVVSLISQYDACMDVIDSDHKPVRALFSVDIARVDESVRRQEFGDIVKYNDEVRNMLEQLCQVPETIVSTNNIILQNQDTTVLRITNKSDKDKALFEIVCEGQSVVDRDGQASDHHPGVSFGFPRWLEVVPAVGMIEPDQLAEVSVQLEDFPTYEEFVDGVTRNSWCEDTRDEEVILVVKVRGAYNTTETKNHRIRVRHCCSGQTRMIHPKPHVLKQGPANILHRSDYQHLSSSYDVVDHLRNLHSP